MREHLNVPMTAEEPPCGWAPVRASCEPGQPESSGSSGSTAPPAETRDGNACAETLACGSLLACYLRCPRHESNIRSGLGTAALFTELRGLGGRVAVGWLTDLHARGIVGALELTSWLHVKRFYLREPRARLYLAEIDGEPVGIGGLRPLSGDDAEIKRMYVRPSARGRGVGRAILQRLIDDARALGYRTIRLDSACFMHEAHALLPGLRVRSQQRAQLRVRERARAARDPGLHAPRSRSGLANSGVAFGLLGRLARHGSVQTDPRRDEVHIKPLAVAKQALQRFDPGVSVAVSQLGERGCSKRDLAERRQPLSDEPLQPAQRRAFVAGHVDVRQELAQQKRVGEG
jgi:GNAT superfamily N-acetyltransferase